MSCEGTPPFFCVRWCAWVGRTQRERKEVYMERIGEACTLVSTCVAVFSACIALIECVIHCRDRKRRMEAVRNDRLTQGQVAEESEDLPDAEPKEAVVASSRDTQRYSLDGQGPYPKNRLVLEVIRQYVQKHPDVTYSELQRIFPATLRGLKHKVFWGCFNLKEDAQKLYNETGYVRHFIKDNETIKLADGREIAVSTQWGIGNIGQFINCARGLGFVIKAVDKAGN